MHYSISDKYLNEKLSKINWITKIMLPFVDLIFPVSFSVASLPWVLFLVLQVRHQDLLHQYLFHNLGLKVSSCSHFRISANPFRRGGHRVYQCLSCPSLPSEFQLHLSSFDPNLSNNYHLQSILNGLRCKGYLIQSHLLSHIIL